MQLSHVAMSEIGLEPKERSVLVLLARRRHLSHEQILIHLYAGKPCCEHPENASDNLTTRKTIERICRKVSAHIPDFEVRTTDYGWELPREAAERLKSLTS
jgi:hypothetical protein